MDTTNVYLKDWPRDRARKSRPWRGRSTPLEQHLSALEHRHVLCRAASSPGQKKSGGNGSTAIRSWSGGARSFTLHRHPPMAAQGVHHRARGFVIGHLINISDPRCRWQRQQFAELHHDNPGNVRLQRCQPTPGLLRPPPAFKGKRPRHHGGDLAALRSGDPGHDGSGTRACARSKARHQEHRFRTEGGDRLGGLFCGLRANHRVGSRTKPVLAYR